MVDGLTRRATLAGAAASLAGLAGYAQAPAYEALRRVENGARVQGVLKYAGPPVEEVLLQIKKDAGICGDTPRVAQPLRVSSDGSLADCVVQIKGVTRGKQWSPFLSEAKIFQHECRFDPYVQIVPHGATLYVLNLDSILHNIHAYEMYQGTRRSLFNFSQPRAGQEDRVPMNLRRGHLVSIDCNVHNWMASWIFTSESPYLMVTGEDGRFDITDIPAGQYELSAWHPVLGEKNGALAVNPGDNFDFEIAWS